MEFHSSRIHLGGSVALGMRSISSELGFSPPPDTGVRKRQITMLARTARTVLSQGARRTNFVAPTRLMATVKFSESHEFCSVSSSGKATSLLGVVC